MKPRRAPQRATSRTAAERDCALTQWLVLATDARVRAANADDLAKQYGLDARMVQARLQGELLRRGAR